MICGEGWRGAAFLGGWLAAHAITLTGLVYLKDAVYWAGIAGAQAVRIASSVDAAIVAKVKNMYEHDLMSVSLYPSYDYIKTSEGLRPTAGLTLAVRF